MALAAPPDNRPSLEALIRRAEESMTAAKALLAEGRLHGAALALENAENGLHTARIRIFTDDEPLIARALDGDR